MHAKSGGSRKRGVLGWACLLLAGAFLVASCTDNVEYNYPTRGPGGKPTYKKKESIFGGEGLTLFSTGDDANPGEGGGGGGGGIGVNSFLWRASLDTVSFMPLASADPFGGVIITDWYAPPDSQDERFKINIFILDRTLRSDGIRAKVFKQKQASGTWVDQQTDEALHRQLEDAILTRARQMRIGGAGS
jgi:hypothetical protein